MYKKFVFVKDYNSPKGLIKKGSEITLLKDIIFFNNGQITPVYYEMFMNLIEEELSKRKSDVIKEIPIPFNKV